MGPSARAFQIGEHVGELAHGHRAAEVTHRRHTLSTQALLQRRTGPHTEGMGRRDDRSGQFRRILPLQGGVEIGASSLRDRWQKSRLAEPSLTLGAQMTPSRRSGGEGAIDEITPTMWEEFGSDKLAA